MKLLKRAIALILILFCSSAHSNYSQIEELASVVSEAQVLIETRIFLKQLNEQRKNGVKLDRQEALEVSAKVESIALQESICNHEQVDNILRSQAYALVAGISGILSKENHDLALGKKSYQSLVKAKELNPNNIDAIKGQALALNMILAKNWALRKLAATSLGINLKDAQRELIDDLRRFPEREDLMHLAELLEDRL